MNTPKIRQSWILDELRTLPNISYTEVFAKYSPMFAKSKKTFDKDWKKATEEIKTYQIALQKEKEAISIKEDTKLFKEGLKTKAERLLIYQKQINDIEAELELGTTEDVKSSMGEPTFITRSLLPVEKSSMRKTLKDLQAEISKIEGDYAPTKTELSGEVKTKTDLTKLSTEILEAIISAQNTEYNEN